LDADEGELDYAGTPVGITYIILKTISKAGWRVIAPPIAYLNAHDDGVSYEMNGALHGTTHAARRSRLAGVVLVDRS